MPRWVPSFLALVVIANAAAPASAQSLGRFTWQLQPYCNVVTATVTGVAGVYTLEGFDDQCGAATRAPLTGVATPNPDGSIGFGMNLVTSPGGRGVHVEARISLATLTGPWTDSDGNTGTFAFNQRAAGSPRPVPASASIIPSVFGLRADGGFVAGGTFDVSAIPSSGAGTRMMWHPGRSAFRAGSVSSNQWDENRTGPWSVAFGLNTVAVGHYSFAHGQDSSATAFYATAVGQNATAGGDHSLAVGANVVAGGNNSVALGGNTEASGHGSFAAGIGNDAYGFGSVALGRNVVVGGDDAVAIGTLLDVAGDGSAVFGYNAGTTGGGRGSFLFGDRASNSTFLQAFAPNQFLARAAGGTKFFSNAGLSAGVVLAPGASAWASVSDVNSKENFRELDDTDVLTKLARMSIREWNYKAQDAAIRHVGPTAQDFHDAFGLGEDPLRISTIDADGIALAAVSALARENAALKAQLAALSARLDAVERARN
jgi:hypothetical protein